jgi:hypothetical protein
MFDLIGKTVGPYRILEQIGVGGMATVYKAYQPSMDRYVAVKILPHYLSQDPEFAKRFQREARAIARLEHAHILPVHDYGEYEGIAYIVMRYVEAGTLKDRMAQGPLPLDEVDRLIGQIGGALDYAHRLGVIHRDIKPGNVLMDAQGDTFLTDFGLARMIEATQQLTGSGVGVGTPAYMSPEQGQGVKVDHRSDIYSLGVILYEMVTGRVPYEAETPMAVVIKHITDPLPLPRTVAPNVPEPIERVILKALAKTPADRFQTAGELLQALTVAVRQVSATEAERLAERPIALAPAREDVSLITRVERIWEQPRGKVALVGGAVAVVVLLGFLLSRLPGSVQILGPGVTATPAAGEGTLVALAASATPSHTATLKPTATRGAPTLTRTPAPTRTLNPLEQGERLDVCGSDLCFYDFQNRTTPIGLAKDFVLVSASGSQFSSSPDGARIVFSGCSFTELAASGDCRGDIYIANRDGSNVVRLRGVPATYELRPSWSPDGKFIVFNEGWTIWRIDPDGIELKQIAFGELIAESYMYVWSPDSQRIAWASGRHKESGEPDWDRLYVINRDGSGLRSLLYSPDPLLNGQVAWSPDGQSLAVGFHDGTTHLFSANCDSTPTGCERSSATEIEAIPQDWLPNFRPQWLSAYADPQAALYGCGFEDQLLYAEDFEDGEVFSQQDPWQIEPAPDGIGLAEHIHGRSDWFSLVLNSVRESRISLRVMPIVPGWNLAFRNSVRDGQAASYTVFDTGISFIVDESLKGIGTRRFEFREQEWNSLDVIWESADTVVVYLEGEEVSRYAAGATVLERGTIGIWIFSDQTDVWFDDIVICGQEATTSTSVLPTATTTAVLSDMAEQARAFAEPILAAIKDRSPDFADDFSNPNSGWWSGSDQYGQYRYSNGEYVVIANPDSGTGAGPGGDFVFSDFVAEVGARIISASHDGGWAFTFRDKQPDAGSRYSVGFWFDGWLDFLVDAETDYEPFSTQGAPVRAGPETNHLLIVAKGPDFAIYVNGEPVTLVRDETFASGVISLGIHSRDPDQSTEVRFDNFKIWDISDMP